MNRLIALAIAIGMLLLGVAAAAYAEPAVPAALHAAQIL
jgi:hypothetical protein